MIYSDDEHCSYPLFKNYTCAKFLLFKQHPPAIDVVRIIMSCSVYTYDSSKAELTSHEYNSLQYRTSTSLSRTEIPNTLQTITILVWSTAISTIIP